MAKKKAVEKPADGSMSLGGHFKELRNRLLVVAVVFVVVVTAVLANAGTFVNALMDMAMNANSGYQFVAIAPQEKLLQYFRIAVVAGVIAAIPFACYEAWAFAKPGLKKTESRFFGAALFFGLILFCIGAAFAYFITLPFMLNFLFDVGDGTVAIETTISIAEYISFVLTIFVIFGAIFEMPLLTVILAKLGIANPELMKKGRGVAIVLCFVLAAIITPPDIVSQIMVAVPMIVLYQISIMLAGVFYKEREESDDDDDDTDDDDDE